jgi:hypothetical protein
MRDIHTAAIMRTNHKGVSHKATIYVMRAYLKDKIARTNNKSALMKANHKTVVPRANHNSAIKENQWEDCTGTRIVPKEDLWLEISVRPGKR